MDNGPLGVYHRTCYQAYTNRDHIAKLKRKRDENLAESADNEDLQPFKRHHRSKASSLPKNLCDLSD